MDSSSVLVKPSRSNLRTVHNYYPPLPEALMTEVEPVIYYSISLVAATASTLYEDLRLIIS